MKRLSGAVALILSLILTVSTVAYAGTTDGNMQAENAVSAAASGEDTDSAFISSTQEDTEATGDIESITGSRENVTGEAGTGSDITNDAADTTTDKSDSSTSDKSADESADGASDEATNDKPGDIGNSTSGETTDGKSDDAMNSSSGDSSDSASGETTNESSKTTDGTADGTENDSKAENSSDADSKNKDNETTVSSEDKKDTSTSEDKPDTKTTKTTKKVTTAKEATLEADTAAAANAAACSIDTSKVNADTGTGYIYINGISSLSNVDNVKLHVWCEESKEDLYRYSASARSDGSYRVRMAKFFHEDHYGTYYAKAYVTFKDGSSKCVTETTFTVNKPADPSIDVTKSGSYYVFTLTNIPNVSQVTAVKYKIWSNVGGVETAKWYNGSLNKYTLKSSIKKTLSTHYYGGTYTVQAYATLASGDEQLICAKNFTVKKNYAYCTSFKVTEKVKSGKFVITVGGVSSPTGVSSIKVAVWSKDDQSDLHWYTMSKNSSGNYTVTANIKNHNYNCGTYYAHVYLYDTNGKSTFLGGKSVDFNIKSGDIEVTESSDKMHYPITIKSLLIPGGATRVEFAVWSDKNGQDDLGWYLAEGSNGGDRTASVSIMNHATAGLYHVHAYVTTKSGSMVYVGGTTFEVIGTATGKITTSGVNDGNGEFSAKVSITSANPAVATVKVNVWNTSNSSFVKSYVPPVSSDGTYNVNINIADFSGLSGTYKIQAYATLQNGDTVLLETKSQNFCPDSYIAVGTSNGTKIRTVAYKNSTLSSVRFKVWSQVGGNSDCKWYDVQPNSDGVFYINVNMDDFAYDGKYFVRVYSGSTLLEKASFIMIDYLEQGIAFANDESIGYSQVHRYLNPDLDCSSFVYYTLKLTGYSGLPSSAFSTWTEAAVLEAAGFTKYKFTSIADLQVGDILLVHNSSRQHTEIYAGNGYTVGAHSDEDGDIYGRLTGDQTGKEVSLVTASSSWEYYFRYRTYN